MMQRVPRRVCAFPQVNTSSVEILQLLKMSGLFALNTRLQDDRITVDNIVGGITGT